MDRLSDEELKQFKVFKTKHNFAKLMGKSLQQVREDDDCYSMIRKFISLCERKELFEDNDEEPKGKARKHQLDEQVEIEGDESRLYDFEHNTQYFTHFREGKLFFYYFKNIFWC